MPCPAIWTSIWQSPPPSTSELGTDQVSRAILGGPRQEGETKLVQLGPQQAHDDLGFQPKRQVQFKANRGHFFLSWALLVNVALLSQARWVLTLCSLEHVTDAEGGIH